MTKTFIVLFAVLALLANIAFAVEDKVGVPTDSAPLFKDTSTGIELVFVKGGCFKMGDNWGDGVGTSGDGDSVERPVHEACVDNFYFGKYEVTQGQWKLIMGSNPSSISTCNSDKCPVDNVNWSDVQLFINRLNSKSGGNKYRLPTEAEWEYAARSGGKNERYSGGNDIESVSWFEATSGYRGYTGNPDTLRPYAHPVGNKTPNGLGIFDMSGNVWEMTNDWYGENYYASSPRKNPAGPSAGVERVKRGGCSTGGATNSRVSRRGTYEPDTPNWLVGLRLLMIP
jgi:formylglycine-generating enzyme required for sulfatase activity